MFHDSLWKAFYQVFVNTYFIIKLGEPWKSLYIFYVSFRKNFTKFSFTWILR